MTVPKLSNHEGNVNPTNGKDGGQKKKRTRKQNDDTQLPGKKRKYIRKENKQQEKIKNVDSSLKTTTSVTISVPEKVKRKYTRKVKYITEKRSKWLLKKSGFKKCKL